MKNFSWIISLFSVFVVSTSIIYAISFYWWGFESGGSAFGSVSLGAFIALFWEAHLNLKENK